MENNEEIVLTIFNGYMIFKSQFTGLNKKIKNTLRNWLKIDEIKVTIKIDSNISNKNLCYYLKLPV